MLDSIKSVNLTQLNFWSQLGSFNFQTQCYFCSQLDFQFEQDSRASSPQMPNVLLELFKNSEEVMSSNFKESEELQRTPRNLNPELTKLFRQLLKN